MANQREKQLKKTFDTTLEKQYQRYAAVLGDGAGNVIVSARGKDWVYARTIGGHDWVICRNKRVPAQNNTKVWIGFSKEFPSQIQVLGLRDDDSTSDTLQVPLHAQTHEYGLFGTDVVHVSAEQFMPWMVEPIGGLQVRAYRGIAQISGTIQYLDTQTFDLTGYKPATGSMYIALGFVGNNTLQVRTGPIRAARTQLTYSDIPSFGHNFFPLTIIAMDSSATELNRSLYKTDFLDPRFLGYTMNADTLGGLTADYFLNAANISGSVGGGITAWDDGVFKGTASIIDFRSGISASVSGTVITVDAGGLTPNDLGHITGTLGNIDGTIFTHFTTVNNTGTVETDLYSDSLSGAVFKTNGDSIEGMYSGAFVSSASATRQLKLYFAGTAVFDSGALSVSVTASWTIRLTLMRVSASVVRYTVVLESGGMTVTLYDSVGELTGLTLSSANILKVTGTAAGVGAATSDITATLSKCVRDPV